MARGLKFGINEREGLYYLCSENKGTDQLRGYREADLRLCFRICKISVFSRRGSFHFKLKPSLLFSFLWCISCIQGFIYSELITIYNDTNSCSILAQE